MHPLLIRQLKRLSLEGGKMPASSKEWQQLLERVSNAYVEADQNRKMVERSLALSSREMQELYENLERVSEAQLREEKEHTRQIIDHSLDAIVSMDARGHILTWNPHAEKLFGWTQGEVLGQLLADQIVPSRYRHAHGERLQSFISTGTGPLLKVLNQRIEAIALHRNGSEFPIELTIVPLRKDDSYGFCSFIRDISAQKRNETISNSVRKIEAQFITSRSLSQNFSEFLEVFLSLTGSAFGFIGEILHQPNGEPFLKAQAISDIAWNQETRELYDRLAPNLEFLNLKTLFGAVITTGKPVISNDPANDPRSGGLPHGHPPLNAFLGLPFFHGHQMIGMVGIANRPGGYDSDMVRYLEPMGASCARLIHAYRSDQRREMAEIALKQSEQSIRELYDTTSVRGGTFQQRVSALLEMGCRRFNLPVGLLTKVNGDTLQIVASFPSNGSFAVGHCVPLCESICQTPLKINAPVAYEHAGGSEWKTHPGYVSLKLEAYLGTPVNVSSQAYGTLCFVSPEPYPSTFTEADKNFVKLMAQWVEGELERLNAEDALKDSEERFRQLAENIPEVFWLMSSTLQEVIYLSPTFEQVWGQSDTAIYENANLWLETIHQNDRSRVENAFTQKVLIGTFDEEYRIVRPDRTVRFIRNRGFPVRDEHGNVSRIAGIAQDITERKQLEDSILQLNTELEERVQQRTAELESKNAELERFTYTVSHDLKSPLVTIEGFLNLVEQDVRMGDTVRLNDDIHRIHGATRKMQGLLNELLELSRIGRVISPPEVVAINDVVHEAVDRVRGNIAERGVQLDIAPRLPMVYGDYVRLVEVVQNLVANAVKFMGDQPAPRITIGVRQAGKENIFFVQDNGIGIDPPYHEKIFGLFERLDTHSEGSGIGLALVKRIIEVHQGRIWVESQGPGCGTRFCWTLACKKDGSMDGI